MRANNAMMQMHFKIEYWDDREDQEVITGPSDIAAWEARNPDKPIFRQDGAIQIIPQMWLAWHRLYRLKQTSEQRFDDWRELVAGFQPVDESDDAESEDDGSNGAGADPTPAPIQPAAWVS